MKEADDEAKAAYGNVIAALNGVKNGNPVSDGFQNDLKSFLCDFYLPQCTADTTFLRPNYTVTLAPLMAAFNGDQQTAAFAACGAFSAYRASQGATTKYPSGLGIQGWEIGVIVIVGGALVGGVAFAIFQRTRSKRAEYEAV